MRKLELSKSQEERAAEVHQKAIFINALDDSPLINGAASYVLEGFMPKLVKEGVTVLQETISDVNWDLPRTINAIGEWYEVLRRGSDKILLATTAEDIRRAKKEGKIAVIFGFQHAPLNDDLNMVEVYHRLGVRVMQITYSERNSIGDGCSENANCGLSNFGREVVAEMNRLGMLIDLSHVGDRTTTEAIELSKDPCCFTHSNPRALCNKARNKTDEQIKALAEKGGVMGLSFFTHLIRDDKLPTFWGDYLDFTEYVIDLVGVDHVGAGLDVAYGVTVHHPIYKKMLDKHPSRYAEVGYTQEQRLSWYMNEENRWFDITRGLVYRGYSDQEIEKILGLNFLKLFERVWQK